jgi:hypothetical protein
MPYLMDSPPLRERFLTLNATTSQDAAALAAQGKKATLWDLVVAPFLTFLKVYIGQNAWRKGIPGFIDAMFASYEVFVRHTKLWELHHPEGKTPSPPRQ